MDNLHEEVVKLAAEILKKSWNPEPGKVTPFSSSSSMHPENNDNHLEHYVKPSPKSQFDGAIAEIFNSNFWTNGGEKMTEKTLDVDSSTTEQEQYNNPGASTTEPDPQSELAITKSLEGEGTYSTTANTTEQAPSAGETTEPVAKAEDSDNDSSSEPDADADDAKAKADKKAKQLKKAKKLIKKYKKAKKLVKAAKKLEVVEKQASETTEQTIEKSATAQPQSKWGNAFSPQIKRGM